MILFNRISTIIIMLVATISFSQETNNKVVLELFTSQGCSSCPSADVALNNAKQENNNVIVMSYHVDYWNYIGWKDPFSKTIYADKQRRYAKKFNSSSIFTPQTVVNGKEHFVGSDVALLNGKINEYSKLKNSNTIILKDIKRLQDSYSFKYIINGDLKDKILRITLVINKRETKVNRGENSNRTLLNTNIVVNEITKVVHNKTALSTITIPDVVKPSDKLSLIIIVEDKTKAINGALEVQL